MRTEYSTLCGRDHTSFRSYYFPIKAIIDGDMCEKFSNLDAARQKTIADELDRTPNEVDVLIYSSILIDSFIILHILFKGFQETRGH